MKIPCSVPILTLNVKAELTRLLPVLVDRFEDVYLVDGNSTDGTQAYAQSLGVRVERQFDHDMPNSRITDFTAARLRSFGLARSGWIFLVDADEMPSPELLDQVERIVSEDARKIVHAFPRVAVLPDGRTVRHAFFYPEYTMVRLFHRAAGLTLASDRHVHERFILPEGVALMRHAEPFMHAWPEPAEFRQKMERYVSMEYAEWTGSFKSRLRWMVWYNLRSAAGQFVRAVRSWLAGTLRGETVLPWAYTWPMIAYRFKAMRRGLTQRVMSKK